MWATRAMRVCLGSIGFSLAGVGISSEDPQVCSRRNISNTFDKNIYYTYLHTHKYTYVYVYMYTCMYTYKCMYIKIHTCIYIYTPVYIHMYTYLHMTCLPGTVHANAHAASWGPRAASVFRHASFQIQATRSKGSRCVPL